MTFTQFLEQVVINVLTFGLPIAAVLYFAVRLSVKQAFKSERKKKKDSKSVMSEV